MVLEFLQDGLEKGHQINTLRKQVAALQGILWSDLGIKLSVHPHVKHFLQGVALLMNPPTCQEGTHLGSQYCVNRPFLGVHSNSWLSYKTLVLWLL